MIDKWLTLGITVDQAQAFRLIEDACRDAGDYGFFSRVRDEIRRGADAADVLRRYWVRTEKCDAGLNQTQVRRSLRDAILGATHNIETLWDDEP